MMTGKPKFEQELDATAEITLLKAQLATAKEKIRELTEPNDFLEVLDTYDLDLALHAGLFGHRQEPSTAAIRNYILALWNEREARVKELEDVVLSVEYYDYGEFDESGWIVPRNFRVVAQSIRERKAKEKAGE